MVKNGIVLSETEAKIELLKRLCDKGIVAQPTVEHIVFSEGCTCGHGFTYDFCPIAGDYAMLVAYKIDTTNFDASLSHF